MKRIIRDRYLTPEEAARDRAIWSNVRTEFPPAGDRSLMTSQSLLGPARLNWGAFSNDRSLKGMKPFIHVYVYILTDSVGEWWEFLKTDGSLSRFYPGTARFKEDKKFKTVEAACLYCDKHGFSRYRVLREDPPVRPSRTWVQTVLFEKGATGVLCA